MTFGSLDWKSGYLLITCGKESSKTILRRASISPVRSNASTSPGLLDSCSNFIQFRIWVLIYFSQSCLVVRGLSIGSGFLFAAAVVAVVMDFCSFGIFCGTSRHPDSRRSPVCLPLHPVNGCLSVKAVCRMREAFSACCRMHLRNRIPHSTFPLSTCHSLPENTS